MLSEQFAKFRIGSKIAHLRTAAGLSARTLATATGIPEDAVAKYESSESLPTLAELVTLAEHLHVGVEYFFQVSRTHRKVEVVRSRDRWAVQPQTRAAQALNFRYQALAYQLTDRLLSPYLVEIPPSQDVAVEPSTHAGEEFLFVLAGKLEADIGGETHRLDPGDSLYFSSGDTHALRARGAQVARLLACVANVTRLAEQTPLERAFSGLE